MMAHEVIESSSLPHVSHRPAKAKTRSLHLTDDVTGTPLPICGADIENLMGGGPADGLLADIKHGRDPLFSDGLHLDVRTLPGDLSVTWQRRAQVQQALWALEAEISPAAVS
jgi:hypothetical protein